MVSDSVRGQVSVKMGRYFYPCRNDDLLRLSKEEIETYKKNNKIVSEEMSENSTEDDDLEKEQEDTPRESEGSRIQTDYITVVGNNIANVDANQESSKETVKGDDINSSDNIREQNNMVSDNLRSSANSVENLECNSQSFNCGFFRSYEQF